MESDERCAFRQGHGKCNLPADCAIHETSAILCGSENGCGTMGCHAFVPPVESPKVERCERCQHLTSRHHEDGTCAVCKVADTRDYTLRVNFLHFKEAWDAALSYARKRGGR